MGGCGGLGNFPSALQLVVGCVHRAANGGVQQGGRDFQCICRGELLDGGAISSLSSPLNLSTGLNCLYSGPNSDLF